MKELKDFLENIRKYSPKIGEMAMRHAAQKLNVDPTLLASGGQDAKKLQVIAPQPNPFTGNLDKGLPFHLNIWSRQI